MSFTTGHVGVDTTATQLPNVVCRRVLIKLRNLGAAEVYLGDSSLVGTIDGNGFPVGNDGVVLEQISNLNEVYAISSVQASLRYIAER